MRRLLLLAAVAGAAAAVTTPAPASASEPPEVTFGGFAAFDWYQYLEAVGDRAPSSTESVVPAVAQVRLAPRLKAKYKFVRAVGEVEFRHDFLDPDRGSRVILREAAVGFRKFGFELEAGALQARWGKMDVDSPTDNLVAWDYEELLFREPLPIPGVQLGFARGLFSAEVIVSPAFRPSRFRRTEPSRWDNRWGLPRTQTVPLDGADDLVFDNVYAVFTEPVLVGSEDETNLLYALDLGARVDLFLPSVDLGVSFAYTRDKLPTYTHFSADEIDDGRAYLTITPHHDRLLIPGFDVAVNVWRLVFKGEAAYFGTADADASNCLIDDPYIKYALGAELMLNEIAGDFGLAFRVQYNGDVTTASQDDIDAQAEACPGGQEITIEDPEVGLTLLDYRTGFQASPETRHPYEHAFYWNVHADFPYKLAFDLRGFATIHGDALLRGHFSWEALDRMTVSAGALVWLATGDGTFFHPYGRNSRVEIALRYNF